MVKYPYKSISYRWGMIHVKDHKTMAMFDPWWYLGPKRKKLLEQSWPGLFRKFILNELPVQKIAKYFKDDFGRPTKELYCASGVLVLQQMQDLSDDETITQMAFNTQWHYALDITEEADEAKYMSLKTLWNFRKRVIGLGLEEEIFTAGTEKLAKAFNVATDKQRIDSVHIRSNMKRLGRINIFSRSLCGFLVNLKRHHREVFEALPDSYKERYLTDKAMGCFSMVKPSEAEKTLKELSADLYELAERFKDNEKVSAMTTYKLIRRVLREQCVVKEGGCDSPVEVSVKPSKEVPSDSLQNPSDPEATYDGHKGQGYQVQVMETYSRKEEEGGTEPLNLITYVSVEPAHQSDANAMMPALEAVAERGLEPKELLADSLYGSDDNKEAAKVKGIEVVSPAMGHITSEGLSLADFEKTEMGEISSCPGGHMPLKTKIKGDRRIAVFELKQCGGCGRLASCPVKQGKRHYYFRYDEKQVRLAERRAYENTEGFKDIYRYRAGVEATMSSYDRLTGVKRLRVRGLKAVRFCATLKALGVNIFRATAFRARKLHEKEAIAGSLTAINHCFYESCVSLKELYRHLVHVTGNCTANNAFVLHRAA
jgi:hypothetical protein